MYRLLPKNHIRALERHYRIGLGAVLAWSLTFVVAIGAISLFPSYVLLNTQTKELEGRLIFEKTSANHDDEKSMETKLKETKKLLGSFDISGKSLQPSSFIQLINKNRISGISVNSFDVHSNGSGTDLNITGKAATRDALDSFEKKLEKDPQITKVVLPISDLAKSKDIYFSMAITTKY